MGRKIGIAVGIIILVAALVVCLIPLKTVAYTVMVDYQDTKPYLVESVEPLDYEVVSTHIDVTSIHPDEPDISVLMEYGPEEYTKQLKESWWANRTEIIPVACVVVQNIDTISGTFNVSFSVSEPLDVDELSLDDKLLLYRTLSLDPNEAQTETLSLSPGQTGEARCPAYELGHWEYEVTPSTKTVTKTEYREVTKQRPETRYKKVTLLDYWLHY